MNDIEISLLPVLIGGLLAGAGGLAGIAISNWHQSSRDRVLLLRDKLELLITTTFQLVDQVSRHRIQVLYENVNEYDKDYLDVIQMITYLYFPELENDVQKLTELHVQCEDQTFHDSQQMKSDITAWKDNVSRDIAFSLSFKELIKLRNGLADRARTLMKTNQLC